MATRRRGRLVYPRALMKGEESEVRTRTIRESFDKSRTHDIQHLSLARHLCVIVTLFYVDQNSGFKNAKRDWPRRVKREGLRTRTLEDRLQFPDARKKVFGFAPSIPLHKQRRRYNVIHPSKPRVFFLLLFRVLRVTTQSDSRRCEVSSPCNENYFTDGARSGISGYFFTRFWLRTIVQHDKALYSSSQQVRRIHTRSPDHDGQRRVCQGAPHSRGAPQGTVLLRATRICPPAQPPCMPPPPPPFFCLITHATLRRVVLRTLSSFSTRTYRCKSQRPSRRSPFSSRRIYAGRE